jgi:hypothetical protein
MDKLCQDKLAASDITPAEAKKAGIHQLTAKEMAEQFPNRNGPSFKIPYRNIDGSIRADMYRVRHLGKPKRGAFGETAEELPKYTQPAGTRPAAYFAAGEDWTATIQDPTAAFSITEGEIKAACMTKHGMPCIGLGGVWSFAERKRGLPLIPDLEQIVWKDRKVTICFDSDVNERPDLFKAVMALMDELRSRGALPAAIVIPSDGAEKVGVDDYIVAHGADSMAELLASAEFDDLAQQLSHYNSRYAYIYKEVAIYDEWTGQRFRPRDFIHSAKVTDTALQSSGDPDKPPTLVKVADYWHEWPMRREYLSTVYRPGKPKVTDGNLNIWKPGTCTAKKGNLAPWKKLLDTLFEDAPKEHRDWFENWLLYPVANPGVKMKHAAAIWSGVQGIGKSLIGETMVAVYGEDNSNIVLQEQLESGYTDWIAEKQFIMIDEVSGYDSRHKADKLKGLITIESLNINKKYTPVYKAETCANFYITSNRPDAFYVDEQDRRMFIHEATCVQPPQEFFDEYHAWLDSGEGPAAILYAAQKHKFTGFDPNTRPPVTEAKIDMVQAGRGELDSWLYDVRDNPDEYLRYGQVRITKDLVNSEEFLAMFEPHRKGKPVTRNVMAMHLRRVFPRTKRLKIGGRVDYWYIVRNAEAWKKANNRKIRRHLEK